MKKKLLVWLLVAVLALGSIGLVACANGNDLAPEVLEELLGLVKSNNESITSKTTTFTVAGSATTFLDSGEQAKCDVLWTITGTDKVTVSEKDASGKVTITFPGTISEDINFTLTATLVNSNGEAYKKDDGSKYEATFAFALTKPSKNTNHYDYVLNEVANPAEGTPYKLALTQKNLGKYMFVDYEQGSSDYYISLLDNKDEAPDAYIEATTGGYYLAVQNSTGGKLYVNCVTSGNYVNTKLQATASTVYTIDTTNKCFKTTIGTDEYFLGTYGTNDNVRASKVSYLTGGDNMPLYLYTVGEGSIDIEPLVGNDDLPSLGTPAATLDLTKTANRTSYSTEQSVYVANGITFTNDKANSSTNNVDMTSYENKDYRAYSKSTIKVDYTGMKYIKITLNIYAEYQSGFDGMTVDGATFYRSGNILVIEFASPVNSFQSTGLGAQVRITSIEVFTA